MEETVQKIKIGFFCDAFYPMVDGVIHVVDNLATMLLNQCEITVFTVGSCKRRKDDRSHPYKVVTCKTTPVFFLDYDMPCPNVDNAFKKALKESNLDIVYIHSPMGVAKMGVAYAKKMRIPVVSHLHSQYKRDFYRATRSKPLTNMLLTGVMKVFNQSDCAIAVNELTKRLFIDEYKLTVPTVVINNATDMLPLDDIAAAKKRVNKHFHFHENERILAFVGRVNKLKNLEFLFDSLYELKKTGFAFKFLLVGDGGDMAFFKAQVERLELQKHVIFAGKITDREMLKSVYARTDLFLFPSHYDTDGIVKFEAASQQTPTLFADGTLASSQIIDGETGYVSKYDPVCFANKIVEIFSDLTTYQKVCDNLLPLLYRTWHDSANEVHKLFLKLIAEKKAENAALDEMALEQERLKKEKSQKIKAEKASKSPKEPKKL